MTLRHYVHAIALTVMMLTSAPGLTGEKYSPPRTPNGKPDLQGVWTNASITTLERSSQYKDLVIPAAELRSVTEKSAQYIRQQTDDGLDPKDGLLNGSDLASGRGYNAFWTDPGIQFGKVKGEYRTSWIVDPIDGKIPYTAQGRAAIAKLQRDNFDGPEGRPLGERCIAVGGRVGPPMVNGLYNNNYQIIQTADHVVILVEMIEHARIVRLDAKHGPSSVRSLFGDSIGWWDGDTLVVETTQFHPLHARSANPAYLSEQAKVTERFTRVSPQQILYEFTVADPAFYSRPWRGEMTFNARKENIYEYACHEGNYAMHGVLAGARTQEKTAAK